MPMAVDRSPFTDIRRRKEKKKKEEKKEEKKISPGHLTEYVSCVSTWNSVWISPHVMCNVLQLHEGNDVMRPWKRS